MNNTFSISDSISMGYDLLKRRFGPIMLLVLVIVLIEVFFQYAITNFLLLFGAWTTIIASILSNLLNAFLGLALIVKALELYDDHDTDLSLGSFFSAINSTLFINYIITIVLYGLIVAIPMLVLAGIGFVVKLFVIDQFLDPSSGLVMTLFVIYIIAVLIVSIHLTSRFYFSSYYIADKITNSPFEALTLSAKATKNNVGNLFFFSLAILLVAILGLLLFLVGLLFAYPIIIIASVHVYRSLANNSSDAEVIAIEEV